MLTQSRRNAAVAFILAVGACLSVCVIVERLRIGVLVVIWRNSLLTERTLTLYIGKSMARR